MATSDERDERRRRRISEKGLNRMSHITSERTQSISSPSLPLLDHDHHLLDQTNENERARDERRKIADKGLNRRSHVTSQSNPPILDHQALFSNDHQAPQTYLSDQITAGPVGVSEVSTSGFLKQSGIHEISSVNSLDVGGHAELQPLQDTSLPQKSSTNAEPLQKPCNNQSNFFSSKRLNSCIIASIRTRSLCALLIALFVLVSYIDYPLLGMNIIRSETIVASRPLYMILLTDLMVILGYLFLDKKGGSEEVEEEKPGPQNDRHNWKGEVKLFERGLMIYRTVGALFMDCSIYAVVVICGLSQI